MPNVIKIGMDCEFTNFDKYKGDMIALGLVEIFDDYTLGRENVFYLRPESSRFWSDGAEKVHKISYFRASVFPERGETLDAITEWLKGCESDGPIGAVYHGNGNLDPNWLKVTYEKESREYELYSYLSVNNSESTLKLSREYLKNLDSHKLDEVAKYYDIELKHHDPLSDARACAIIYCNIMQNKGTWTGRFL